MIPQTHVAAAEKLLGFSVPPYRLDYENFRTDLGIGVLGLHWIMQIAHLPAYRSAGFKVVAACETNQDSIRKTLGKGHQFKLMTSDFHELMSIEEVQVVDCTFGHSPPKEHKRRAVVEAAAAHGKHLMIHKPAASTLGLAEEMARLAEQAGIRLAVNQNCRYNPACYSIKGLLAPERLGPARIIEVQTAWKGHPPKSGDRAGAWTGHIVHHADLIRWWVDAPCVSVFCKAGYQANLTVYEFANGTLAYHGENHSGAEGHEVKIHVYADKGVIKAGHNWNWHFPSTVPNDFVEVLVDREGPGVRLPLPAHVYEPCWSDINPFLPRQGPYYELGAPLAGFIGCMGSLMRGISENRRPDNDISKGIESLRMCLAAELSAASGKPVKPDEVPSEMTSKF